MLSDLLHLAAHVLDVIFIDLKMYRKAVVVCTRTGTWLMDTPSCGSG